LCPSSGVEKNVARGKEWRSGLLSPAKSASRPRKNRQGRKRPASNGRHIVIQIGLDFSVISQIAKKRPKGGNEQLRTPPRTELVDWHRTKSVTSRARIWKSLQVTLLESCREDLMDEWDIVDYGCLSRAASF
jgi:hypothetical protein